MTTQYLNTHIHWDKVSKMVPYHIVFHFDGQVEFRLAIYEHLWQSRHLQDFWEGFFLDGMRLMYWYSSMLITVDPSEPLLPDERDISMEDIAWTQEEIAGDEMRKLRWALHIEFDDSQLGQHNAQARWEALIDELKLINVDQLDANGETLIQNVSSYQVTDPLPLVEDEEDDVESLDPDDLWDEEEVPDLISEEEHNEIITDEHAEYLDEGELYSYDELYDNHDEQYELMQQELSDEQIYDMSYHLAHLSEDEYDEDL
jgi:hypothetical protein